MASDFLPIEKGTIYVAAPNYHLLVKKGAVQVGPGPEENRWRPSIDVLFRSAAYVSRVTGMVLTGLLDDGTAGMWAVNRSGGTCIERDPNEAEYPDMPLSVLNQMKVDHCVSVVEMGGVLAHLIVNKEIKNTEIPSKVRAEAEIAEKVVTGIDAVSKLAEHILFFKASALFFSALISSIARKISCCWCTCCITRPAFTSNTLGPSSLKLCSIFKSNFIQVFFQQVS